MKKIKTNFSVKDGGHYSPGVVYNGVLYVSGQLSIDPNTGKIPAGGIEIETKQALKNLDTVLTSAGTSRNKVLQCRIYIPDIAYWPDLNKVYSDFFGNHKPARVVVPSNNLYNGCLIEIEAIAECKEVY